MIKVSSLFGQILSEIFSSVNFEKLVSDHGAERRAKGFRSRTQLISMLFCHLARADSLREIVNGLSCCIGTPPKRSTLSYANEHRPAALFEDLFNELLARFRSVTHLGARKTKFRFKNKLFSFDSTTITLCLSLFPWANYRRAKGGVKVHVLLDHDDYMPSFVRITEAKVHDNRAAEDVQLKPGSIVAVDRGYLDFKRFYSWTKQGVFFVTRMKENIRYVVDVSADVPKKRNIVSDEGIFLLGNATSTKYPDELRRIVVRDKEKNENIVLLTNHFGFGATTIASIYKDRWEIELFFKALKQNLKVKTFIGTSENALRIQIWTALVSMLVIKWLHHLSRAPWSFSNMATMLRLNLFTYRDLRAWLDEPYETPPVVPRPEQLNLNMQ